jgi:hypothetical protein
LADTAEIKSAQRGASSLWRPLRVPTFRNLLAANVVSDIGTFMQSGLRCVADGVTPCRANLRRAYANRFVSAIFPAVTPRRPAGDIVDRRKLILVTESWMASVALLLCVLTIAGFMSPWLLLFWLWQ